MNHHVVAKQIDSGTPDSLSLNSSVSTFWVYDFGENFLTFM